MTSDRKQHGPAFAPGEPGAPVAGTQPAPAEPHSTRREQEPGDNHAGPEPRVKPSEHEPRVKPSEHEPRDKHADGEPNGKPIESIEPAEPTEPTDDDHGPEPDLEELAAKAQKADEYLELAQRTKADFENYRKRATRDAATAQDRGVAKLALELLPAVDNLDRALQAAGDAGDGDKLASGVKLVHAAVIAALARFGIEPFSPLGEPFDPQRHEAVAQQPVDGAEPGTVVEVYQRGYCLGDSVLRPARVVVAG
jgi:molecular chaperone GrpE